MEEEGEGEVDTEKETPKEVETSAPAEKDFTEILLGSPAEQI